MDVEETCDMCFEYKRCSNEKCSGHILYDGNIVDFARAMYDGRLWGDVVYEEEKEKIVKETSTEKMSRLKKKGGDERKALDNLKQTILNKNHLKNCVKTDGKWMLKYKYSTICENLKLPDEVLADGSKYTGGCWAHKENACPFMHPDEKDKYDFKGKTKINLIKTEHEKKLNKTWRGGKHKRRLNKTRSSKH